MAAQLNAVETRLISFTGWNYKNYAGSLPNGTCTGMHDCNNKFFVLLCLQTTYVLLVAAVSLCLFIIVLIYKKKLALENINPTRARTHANTRKHTHARLPN
jgi:hypothetical protein